MFFRKKSRDDEKLKELLQNSWKADPVEEKKAFLQRLKVVLPKDHPGLLLTPGKAANGDIASERKVEERWKRRNLVSFVATWAFLFALVGLTFLGIRSLLHVPEVEPYVPVQTDRKDGRDPLQNIQKEVISKYRYRFKGFEISGPSKMSLGELNEAFNNAVPDGITVVITSVSETENFMEERSSVVYNVMVYDLEGTWGEVSEEKEPELNSID